MATKAKKKAKAKKLSAEEKAQRLLQRRHKREIRNVFAMAGFTRADGASDTEFTYESSTSDFDDIFVLENVILLVEYTITKESEVSSHVRPKSPLYTKILDDPARFIAFARGAPLNISSSLSSKYSDHNFRVVVLYCSLNTVKVGLKEEITSALFMDYSYVRYFSLLVRTIKQSCRNELLDFLGIKFSDFADRALASNPTAREPFEGSVLPEAHSNFPKGYKVVSFYIDPGSLLSRAYVLRRDGWRDRGGLYQRMIVRRKIELIRKHLIDHERVFVNNIIVTLPSATKILDLNDDTIKPDKILTTTPARISIPFDFNSIGLIDGQHRVFSYYEGGANEAKISKLRQQQNLLVTGIIYPENATPEVRTRFEASLFLEINSNQANAKSELKQAINQIIRPFASDSVARDVLDAMNDSGPLSDRFERHYFETGKLKTTSVVSYGLRPLVRPTGGGPLFERWSDSDKSTFITSEDDAARKRYVAFCTQQINLFLSAAKSHLPNELWTADRKVENHLLTPTFVNGLVGAMRQGIEAGLVIEFDNIRTKLSGLESFDFSKYRSSQYTVMATDIFTKYLK